MKPSSKPYLNYSFAAKFVSLCLAALLFWLSSPLTAQVIIRPPRIPSNPGNVPPSSPDSDSPPSSNPSAPSDGRATLPLERTIAISTNKEPVVKSDQDKDKDK